MEMVIVDVKCPTLQALRELERELWETEGMQWNKVYSAILNLLHRNEVGSIGLLL